jgi:cytochrome b
MVAAYLLGEEDELLNYHSAVGYMVGILILFRIVWGFAGPKYSRFSDFPIGISKIKAFFTDMKGSKSTSIGHNPGASVVMLAIILFTLMITVSGTLLLASKGQGFFSSFNIGISSDSLKEIHEICVYIVIGLVVLHLLGNLVDFIFNKKAGTLQSMFTGYKNVEGESVQLNSAQKIIATVGIIAALLIFPYSLINQKIEVKSEKTEQKIDNEDEDDD